jgi:hypothetical protein
MATVTKLSTVNMEVTVYANSESITDLQLDAPLSILFLPTTSGDFGQSFTVERTDNSANFSAQFRVGKTVVPVAGAIGSVVVSGTHTFTEASGVVYSDASGTAVTLNGSYPSGSTVHNVSVDFAEGDRSSYGGLTVSASGTFSQAHTYSYPGIYHIITRVQGQDGSVDMDSFRLNLASDLSGSGLGNLTITATPDGGGDLPNLSVAFSATGASGVSIGASEDSDLHWRFGNLETSNKNSPTSNYYEPGSFIPMASFKYGGPSGTVYLSDITSTGAND